MQGGAPILRMGTRGRGTRRRWVAHRRWIQAYFRYAAASARASGYPAWGWVTADGPLSGACQWKYIPPLTPETSPFTKDAAGDARKRTTWATSSAAPSRPRGMVLMVF